MTPAIEAVGLGKTVRAAAEGEALAILSEVSLSIAAGETVASVGASVPPRS